MEAESTNRKTFQILENGTQLGELIYEDLFFLYAEIRLTNSDLYAIKPADFFGTSISVTKRGTEVANLKMNWRGQIVIAFQNGQEFVLKANATFLNKFIIENKDKEQLIQFKPKFNWNKFHYNYDIIFEKRPQDLLLVLLGVYASNYFIATMSGAAYGMA